MHATRNFVRHYVEMLVAMLVGMFALGIPLGALLIALGIDVESWHTDAPELELLGMLAAMLLRRDEYTGHPGRAHAS